MLRGRCPGHFIVFPVGTFAPVASFWDYSRAPWRRAKWQCPALFSSRFLRDRLQKSMKCCIITCGIIS